MLRRTKRFIALVLVVLLSLVVGCSSSNNVSSDTPAKTTSTSSDSGSEDVLKDFPNRNIEIVHAFSPGSLTETYVRLLMESMEKKEGIKSYIGFHQGGGGQVGWSYIANAKPDGYTIGIVQGASCILPVARGEQAWGVDKYSFLCNMMTDPGVIAVAKGSKYKSLTDLVEATKANPKSVSIVCGKLTASDGLALKQIQMAAGCEFNLMPSGSEAEAIAMVRGGHVDALCLNIGDVVNDIESGDLIPVATGDSVRSPFLPDVPTYKEQGYDVKQANMRSLFGPANMPEPVRKYLQDVLIAAMKDPEVVKAAEKLKIPSQIMTGPECQKAYKDLDAALRKQWAKEPWE